MAEVTVSELAKVVGASEERLLKQMKEAGLKHNKASDSVSDEEKQTLLAYLKSLHGSGGSDPKKITLKRKKVETLRTGTTAGRKTVNVEVRKKRTYVKRSAEDIAAQAESEKAAQAASGVSTKSSTGSQAIDDAESKRLAALESRRRAEVEEKERIEEEARVRREEEQKRRDKKEQERRKREQSSTPDVPVAPVAEPPPAHSRKALLDDEDGKPKKKKAGKSKGHNPVADSDNKEWHKHSHRPQDFALHEEDETEEQRRLRLKSGQKAVKIENKHVFRKPTEKKVHEVEIPSSITVGDLAQKMAIKAGELVKILMKMGEMATINQALDQETATLLVEELGHKALPVSEQEQEQELIDTLRSDVEGEEPRAVVVTVMGHVDHGKTSLLDYIRKTKVASGEAGGITQHIGAYRVETGQGQITFLDTPGHAAFTAMRARGAQVTDVVILVVAADDGVMPQTKEAVAHAKAAGVPLVVAVNKIDKEGADPERVKNELSAIEVIPEDWGGETQFIKVSAHTGEGIDELLEAVALQAEVMELKAATKGSAHGVIIESRIEKGRGVVCTALIQQGTLSRSDIMLAGNTVGRVRAMVNDIGEQVKTAGPSTPVEILGLDDVPEAGDEFFVVSDERKAREIAESRQAKQQQERLARQQSQNLENMFANMGEEGSNQPSLLSIVLKADVQGSLQAIAGALEEMGNDEVAVRIMSSGVGGISESDVNLALTTGSIILGFNVRADKAARDLAESEKIEIRYYSVIYQLIDEVKQALSGMLEPETREEIVGIAEVRDVFRSPRFGQIAGCMVVEGSVFRNKPIRVLRDNVVIYEGQLESLRRFKDDVSEVRTGTECGIGVKDYNDVQSGDQIEVYDVTQVSREL